MNKCLVFLMSFSAHTLFSENIKNIPYDWVGQFGLFKQNGKVLFNTDWKSNRLLFDGALSNFPILKNNLNQISLKIVLILQNFYQKLIISKEISLLINFLFTWIASKKIEVMI